MSPLNLKKSVCLWSINAFAALMVGCAVMPEKPVAEKTAEAFEAGSIIDALTGTPIPFKALISRLAEARIVYIGEQHTDPFHHKVQLDIIRALHEKHPRLIIGMEMFDHSYQEILDQWSEGRLDTQPFLEKVHWYANWRYDFDLYREILDFIKARNIRLIGLNLPPHIPPKIRVGGIENLSGDEKKHLPENIDTSDSAHRAYLKEIYTHHHKNVKHNFEYFYMAQCAWEDTMAEAIARKLENHFMVILAGSGHIINKFGIPKRAYQRTNASYLTVLPVSAGQKVGFSTGDYIWVTEK